MVDGPSNRSYRSRYAVRAPAVVSTDAHSSSGSEDLVNAIRSPASRSRAVFSLRSR